ncbi:MAG: ABC transporter substrate-binding protein [Treponema sp.]|jgi:branched-chain amino acid transport system substrate-binding protein|nr:ABC transporter substrate-binding protein [Treponema sp.]
MKKYSAIFFGACFVLVLMACSRQGVTGGTSNENVIRIGVSASVSGDGAAAGKMITQPIELFAKSIDNKVTHKASGKTYEIQFIVEDNENRPEVAATVNRRLIDEHKVAAIIGPDASKTMLAAAPVAQSAKIPQIGTFPTNEKVTQVGNYIFRACFIDPFQGKVAAKYAYENLNARRAAILYNNADDYPTGLQRSFSENFKALGGAVVRVEEYTGSEVKDYSVQLSAIKSSDADVIFLPNLYVELPLQVQQIRQMNITLPIVGGDSFDISEVVTIAGPAIDGVQYVAAFSADSADPQAQEFSKMYFDATGIQPNSNVVLSWESAMIVYNAIQNAAEVTPDGIRNAMAAIKNLQTPSGNFSFDENRNPTKSAQIIRYNAQGQRSYVTTVNP